MPKWLAPSFLAKAFILVACVLILHKTLNSSISISSWLTRSGGGSHQSSSELKQDDECTTYECQTSPRRLLVTEGGILKLRSDIEVRIVRPESPNPALALQDRMQAIKDRMQQRINVKTVWTKEEEALRQWVWRDGQVQPHQSLIDAVQQLSDDDVKLYDWTVQAWHRVNAGSGVGLGTRSPTESSIAQGKVDTTKMPIVKTSGSKPKMALLAKRLQLEPGSGSPLCKSQLKAFQAYKHQHEQTLQGIRAPYFLEHYLPHTETAGSLPDRLLGLASTMLLALASKRTLLVDWQAPMPVDLLFDSPLNIDWSFPFVADAEKVHPIFGDDALTAQRKEVGATGLTKSEIDAGLPGVEWTNYDTKWLRLLLDRDAIFRSFDYQEIGPNLNNLGFKHATAMHCVTNSFLAPKPEALAFASQYAALLMAPAVFSVGIQIRTREPGEPFPSANTAIPASSYRGFFKCANDIATKHASSTQRVIFYLVTDSDTVNSVALEEFGDNLIVSNLEPSLAFDSGMEDVRLFEDVDKKNVMNAAMDGIVELWTLASSDFQVITQGSAFGKFAAMLTGIEGRTVALAANSPEASVDCTSDQA
ncbi:hypothetical protein OIO90_000386 [Microbotryomycetes sp. JL221]|nr:hypothetical protein OIO90_000386 [Microbotryomycetes sp. JL221]